MVTFFNHSNMEFSGWTDSTPHKPFLVLHIYPEAMVPNVRVYRRVDMNRVNFISSLKFKGDFPTKRNIQNTVVKKCNIDLLGTHYFIQRYENGTGAKL